MSDSCGCVYAEPEFVYEVVTEERVTATRNAGSCCECGRAIKKGDVYEHYVGKESESGPTVTFFTCADCLSIRDEFFCGSWVFGLVLDDLAAHINDVDGEVSSECLLRLTKKARERVIDMIDEVFKEIDYWEDWDAGKVQEH